MPTADEIFKRKVDGLEVHAGKVKISVVVQLTFVVRDTAVAQPSYRQDKNHIITNMKL